MLEGLHPNRPTHVMRLITDERSARAMTDLLGEIFDPAETAVAAFEAEDGRSWLLEAYFARQPDEEAVRMLVRPVVGPQADRAEFSALEQRDWVGASTPSVPAVSWCTGRTTGTAYGPTISPSRSRLPSPLAPGITARPKAVSSRSRTR